MSTARVLRTLKNNMVEQRQTAADKLRFIANKRAEAHQAPGFITELRCNKAAWALARTILPVPEEELPELINAYEELPRQNKIDTYNTLRRVLLARQINELGMKRPTRGI